MVRPVSARLLGLPQTRTMVIPCGSLYCEAMTEPLQTAPTLLTIGYESADLDAFLATLSEHGVTLLVDTRERAQSRRRGYSKTALSTALAEQNGRLHALHTRLQTIEAGGPAARVLS